MIPKLTTKEAENLYDKLPEDYQRTLDSINVELEAQKLGKEHKLFVNEIGLLVEIIILVLLGQVRSIDFLSSLAEILPRLARPQVLALAESVNLKILIGVRTNLQKFDSLTQAPTPTQTLTQEPLKTNELPQTQITTTLPVVAGTVSASMEKIPSTPIIPVIPDNNVNIKAKINADPYREQI